MARRRRQRPGRPWKRNFTRARRERFLEVLEASGNVTLAAAEAGMTTSALYRWRERDAALAAAWDAAVEAAERTLGAQGAEPAMEAGGFEVIRRGANGKLQLAAARPRRWTERDEAAFLDLLRQSGNVAASARAVGFDPSSVWERRRKWPAFARAWDEALDEACAALEFRLATLGSDLVPAEGGEAAKGAKAPPFDPDFALRFLKWHHERRAGRGPRRAPREPSMAEVRESILRRIEAIERHRRTHGGG